MHCRRGSTAKAQRRQDGRQDGSLFPPLAEVGIGGTGTPAVHDLEAGAANGRSPRPANPDTVEVGSAIRGLAGRPAPSPPAPLGLESVPGRIRLRTSIVS